ncbi:MAG: FAD-binding oxidoreductase [Ensifer alkalisoli]|nr:FAD-binding oxidoreductase [Sinorhizobium alkalisoli]
MMISIAAEVGQRSKEPAVSEIDGFRGRLISAIHADYDIARAVWNGAIDRRPYLIAQCIGAADVVAAVRFARDHGLEIAIRGGGHNVAGTAVCNDGIVIDLSAMRGVRVDPDHRRAWVQGGALWGDVDHETQAHGLATTGGIVSHTGVAGLTLGGGVGWLMRKHGLTVDNLISVDVVTADGELLRVSEDEHPDLFWALRGGGGNFGVATAFEFRLHSVGPTVLAGPILWDATEAGEVLRFYRDFIRDAPDELGTVVRFGAAPPLPAIPEDMHWHPVLMVGSCYAGPIEDGEQALRPLRAFRTPILDLVGPMPYAGFQSALDSTVVHGWNYYWKSTHLPELRDDLIDVIAGHAFSCSSPRSYAAMFHLKGAVSRAAEDETAFGNRQASHALTIDAVWRPGENFGDRDIAWTRAFFAALGPFREGVYVNFLGGDEDPGRVREAYGDSIYDRLMNVKTRYDPDNAFHHNQNIRPRINDCAGASDRAVTLDGATPALERGCAVWRDRM